MSDLIKALQIFLKYGDKSSPFYCNDETLQIHGYNIKDIDPKDVHTLENLGFHWTDEDDGYFYSFKFGS